ncbi:MAG: hypothetical protein ACKV2T_30125 [Kofleriaceae bacterium]
MAFGACDNSGGNNPTAAQCGDGEDNDGDGMIDFPDDVGCVGLNDESEDSLPSAQCQDGRDNDTDGKIDYPVDPGCFAPQADSETDDCPNGPMCPQCADGMDNDGNGATDYPNDPGCIAASDDNERLSNPVACGASMMVRQLPPDGLVMGELGAASTSSIMSPCGGGGGAPAFAFELHLQQNKVVEVSTDDALTDVDTVIDIRGPDCMQPTSHITCNDDISATNDKSKLTVPLTAGSYFIIVQGHDSAASGQFAMQVKQFAGMGSSCSGPSDCGPGLFCRVALGGSTTTCEKPECDDGLDVDGDTKADYPTDPGCTSKTDNSETDDCPNGANCPECSDVDDNDLDGQADYPNDTTCLAAGDSSESCTTTDGVTLITTGMTPGNTMGANNDVTPPPGGSPLCSTTATHTAPDRTYRLDLPAMSSLHIDTNDSNYDGTLLLLGSSCAGAPIVCRDSEVIDLTSQSAGAYFLVVDGYSGGSGTYTINVSGKIANGGSCESALAQSGAISCNTGFTCKGPAGSRTCQSGLCGDGLDNDGDNRFDYPNDPGCDSLGDDTEANPATPPVCTNAANDDGDAFTDWPTDFGCTSAAGANETFCVGEADVTELFTTNPTSGTTVGLANNWMNATSCTSGSSPMTQGPDKAYGLQIPVFLDSLTVDLSGAATNFDTVVQVRDANCAAQIACDDDSGEPGLQSKLVMSNLSPGGYAIIVDGYGTSGTSGMYTMTVKGIASAGQRCDSPMFAGGANAILACPTACVANVCQ